MLYFDTPHSGECFLLEQVDELSLIKRIPANDYVVVSNLDVLTGRWDFGRYYGGGIGALERAAQCLKKEAFE